MRKTNVKLKPGFTQVCVWPDTTLGEYTVPQFVAWMKKEFGVAVQFLEIITTFPDTDSSGRLVEGTGGRSDLFFAVKTEGIGKFAVPRLQAGIRWIEDVLATCNYDSPIYPERQSVLLLENRE